MALPRQLPTTHDGTVNSGPFISSGGAAYYIGKDDGAIALDALKTTNPSTTAFSVVDASGNPTSSDIRGSAGILDFDASINPNDTDVILVAVLSRTTAAMGDDSWYWDYFSFDMGTDSWDKSTISSSAYDFNVDPALGGAGQIRIQGRDFDGDIVIVGKGPDAPDMGSPYDTLYIAYYDGTDWDDTNSKVRVDEGTAGRHYRYAALSNDDPATGLYTMVHGYTASGSMYGSQFAADHSLNQDSYNWGTGTADVWQNKRGGNLQYVDGSTDRGVVIYPSSTANQLNALRYDPTETSPFSTGTTSENDITGADSAELNYALLCYDPATDTRYCLYIVQGTPDAIKYVSSVSEATWGDITSHSTPANNTDLLYNRAVVGTSPVDGSSKVIAFLYWDATAGTAYYDEIDISAGASYSITGDVTVATTIAATMDYDLNASITSDLTVATTIAAAMDYTFTREITSDVTVSLTVASGIEFGHTQAGDVTLGLVPDASSYLNLPGEAGDNASSPHSSALDITGDLEIRGRLSLPDYTNASGNTWLFSKHAGGDLAGGYALMCSITNGYVRFRYSDGTTATNIDSTVSISTVVEDGKDVWVRVTVDVDDGASDATVTFYYSLEGGSDPDTVSWTQLGSTVKPGAVIVIGSNSTDLYLGAIPGGGEQPMTWDALQVRNGIGGTVVFDVDFTKERPGQTVFVEDSSNAATVTVNQSGDPKAEIVGGMNYTQNASITSDLTLALAIAAAMDYDLNASITGDVTVPTTIAATMDYTAAGFEIVGDVTVPTTIASAMTFGHVQAGDVTLALTVAAAMDYDLNASIAGDVTVSAVPASDATFGHVQAGDVTLGLTIAAAMDYDLNASITSDVTVSTTIAATMLYTPAGFEITGDVTVGLTVAAAMDYDLNASLAGDVALALTVAAAMDYDLNASIVGDVTVPTTVASTITFGHVQTGDVTLALTVASGMTYTPFGGYEIVGDVTVGLTVGAMTIFILDGALDGRIDLTGSITRDLTLASSVTADVGLTATITPEPTLTDPEVV